MNYENGFRVSSWLTVTWTIIVHVFIVTTLLTDLTIGHGDVYANTMLWPVFLLMGFLMCTSNIFFALKGAEIKKSSIYVTGLVSLVALVLPQIFVIALPYR